LGFLKKKRFFLNLGQMFASWLLLDQVIEENRMISEILFFFADVRRAREGTNNRGMAH